MRFVVIAWDGTDPEAADRRAAVRPTHLEEISPFVDRGNIAVGGSILDASDTMIGSILIVDFPSRDALDGWLSADPSMTSGVWRDVEVHPFRAAVGTWLPDP